MLVKALHLSWLQPWSCLVNVRFYLTVLWYVLMAMGKDNMMFLRRSESSWRFNDSNSESEVCSGFWVWNQWKICTDALYGNTDLSNSTAPHFYPWKSSVSMARSRSREDVRCAFCDLEEWFHLNQAVDQEVRISANYVADGSYLFWEVLLFHLSHIHIHVCK